MRKQARTISITDNNTMDSHVGEKIHISRIVSSWELANPAEYDAFVAARRLKTDSLANNFAELPGEGFILRLAYELPESLDVALSKGLDDGERAFLKSTEGCQWFMKTFKQYNVSQKT